MNDIDVENASVLCGCGKDHHLFRGIDALLYWCGDKLKELKAGDYVDVEEE